MWPKSNLTGVLVRRRDLDTQRDPRGVLTQRKRLHEDTWPFISKEEKA